MAKETTKKIPKLTFKNIVGYGCGDCGGVITLTLVSGYLARYLQVHLAINAAVLAIILLIWNAWDTINDPLMGTLLDIVFAKRKDHTKDKFRPWILASIPIMVVGIIAFFTVPAHMGGGIPMLISVFILKIIYEGGYTMMNISMGSLIGAMSTNDQERATLASARGMGSTVGGLIAGFIIPQVLNRVGDNTEGMAVAGIICGVLGGVVVFLHYALTVERNKLTSVSTADDSKESSFKLSDILNIFKNNRAFLALVVHSIGICGVQALGQGAATYMYGDVLHDFNIQSYANIVANVLMIIILLGAPLLTKKWDLVAIIRTCLAIGIVLFGSLLFYVLVLSDLNGWIYMVWSALATGMITLSVQMQWGLVAESIDYNEYLSGKRNEGTIYGFFSLSRRIGTMISNSLSVLLIAGIGYDPALQKEGLEQAASTIFGIKAMVVGFPLLAAIISFLSFTFIWNINKDVRAKMSEWKKSIGRE